MDRTQETTQMLLVGISQRIPPLRSDRFHEDLEFLVLAFLQQSEVADASCEPLQIVLLVELPTPQTAKATQHAFDCQPADIH